MDQIPLRRRCGLLDDTTPLCTILALARCQGLNYDSSRERQPNYISSILATITKARNNPVKISCSSTDWTPHIWSLVSRFVNPLVESWDSVNLLSAFHSCQKNSDPSKYTEILTNGTSFGAKTNSDPEKIDEIETYVMCRHYGITTSRDMSFPDMVMSLKFATMTDFWRMIFAVPCLDRMSFVNAMLSGCKRDLKFNDTFSETFLERPVNITGLFMPVSDREAILAGLKYRIDFTLAKSPLVEYYSMITSPGFPECQYSPVGREMKRICRVNKLRVRFGRYFNPYIPYEYYNLDQLNNFRNHENMDDSNASRSEMYRELQERMFMPNFHHLLQPEVRVTSTYFTCEEFPEIDKVAIVSYGIMSFSHSELSSSEMQVYTLEELAMAFKSTRKYHDSINNITFPDYAISKLKNICVRILLASKVNPEVKLMAKNLSQQICIVEETRKGLNDKIENWLENVRSSDNFDEVICSLKLLIETGMYMRSWKGPPESYPISNKEPFDDVIVSTNVTIALHKYEDHYRTLPENLHYHHLPLFLYKNDKFEMSTENFEGLTIGERIKIVKLGESTPDMSSCVRLSSNWLIGSCYYYLQLLEHRPDFNIEVMFYTT